MHVHGLNSYQGAQRMSILDDDLAREPGINQRIIGVDQDPAATGGLTPARDVTDFPDVIVGRS